MRRASPRLAAPRRAGAVATVLGLLALGVAAAPSALAAEFCKGSHAVYRHPDGRAVVIPNTAPSSIGTDGTVKLTDYGISHLTGDAHLTQSGISGTPSTSPPKCTCSS